MKKEWVGFMTKAESYLYDRLDMLSDEKVILITKINNIEIEIEEINIKIEELSKDVDDAFDFFSPRAKKNDFIRDEIESLNVKKQELSKLIEDLNKQSVLVDEDIFIIKDALGENDLTEEEIKKAKDAIEKSHERDSLGMKILELQESERQRIARELDDSTVQMLSNLVHKCEICSKVMGVDVTRAKLELEIMSNLLNNSVDKMNKIISSLRPISSDEYVFNDVISELVAKIDESTDMNVKYSSTGDNKIINSVMAITFIRIIQEASDNSIKYSNGKNLDIRINYEEDNIQIEIEDDGEGFLIDEILKTDEKSNKGFGIPIIKERVLLLSGEINIDSILNKGTKITINVPL